MIIVKVGQVWYILIKNEMRRGERILSMRRILKLLTIWGRLRRLLEWNLNTFSLKIWLRSVVRSLLVMLLFYKRKQLNARTVPEQNRSSNIKYQNIRKRNKLTKLTGNSKTKQANYTWDFAKQNQQLKIANSTKHYNSKIRTR